MAIGFAYAHRDQRWSGPAFLALNILMLASAPSEGGHYFVDVVAGVAVGLAAIGATGAVRRLLPR